MDLLLRRIFYQRGIIRSWPLYNQGRRVFLYFYHFVKHIIDENHNNFLGVRMTQFLNKKCLILLLSVFTLPLFAGCMTSTVGNDGQLQSYSFAPIEPQWIRDGEPIEFEGELWYPADDTENFIDSEVTLLTDYRGTQVFVDKEDVRPYNRLYTKFGKNKFRYFEKRKTS